MHTPRRGAQTVAGPWGRTRVKVGCTSGMTNERAVREVPFRSFPLCLMRCCFLAFTAPLSGPPRRGWAYNSKYSGIIIEVYTYLRRVSPADIYHLSLEG